MVIRRALLVFRLIVAESKNNGYIYVSKPLQSHVRNVPRIVRIVLHGPNRARYSSSANLIHKQSVLFFTPTDRPIYNIYIQIAISCGRWPGRNVNTMPVPYTMWRTRGSQTRYDVVIIKYQTKLIWNCIEGHFDTFDGPPAMGPGKFTNNSDTAPPTKEDD